MLQFIMILLLFDTAYSIAMNILHCPCWMYKYVSDRGIAMSSSNIVLIFYAVHQRNISKKNELMSSYFTFVSWLIIHNKLSRSEVYILYFVFCCYWCLVAKGKVRVMHHLKTIFKYIKEGSKLFCCAVKPLIYYVFVHFNNSVLPTLLHV